MRPPGLWEGSPLFSEVGVHWIAQMRDRMAKQRTNSLDILVEWSRRVKETEEEKGICLGGWGIFIPRFRLREEG